MATVHGDGTWPRCGPFGRSDARIPALLSRLRRSEAVQATIPLRSSSHALGNTGLSPLETDFTGVSRNLAGVPQLSRYARHSCHPRSGRDKLKASPSDDTPATVG